MTGFPTPHVYLEDAGGAFTHDISAYCRLTAGLSTTRGRNDEQTDVTSGEATLRLDNTDGRFTLGAPMYDGITVDKRLQYVETFNGTDYARFTGYVQEWPTQWESGIANLAYATITVIDRQARLARRKLLSTAVQELLADAPTVLYPLSEAAEATAAGDVSGAGGPVLNLGGTGASPVFGTPLPTTAIATDGALFTAGQYLMALAPTTFTGVEIAFETSDAASSNQQLILLDNGSSTSWQLQITAGTLQAVRIVGGAPTTTVIATGVADGETHVVFVGGASGLYLDGVAQAAGGIIIPTGASLKIGSGLNGVLALAALYPTTLSDARVAAHAAAILTGFADDTADKRLARLAGYANIATADQDLEAGQQPSIAAQDTAGVYALDAMRADVEAEGGLLFISGDGKLTMQNKGHRVLTSLGAAALTPTADQVDARSLTIAGDKNYLFNTGTGTGASGAQQRIVNQASVDVFEEYDVQRDVALLPDALVLNQLQWITTMYGEPQARITSLQLDLLTLPDATVQAALALEIGDRVTLSALPVQSPTASLDLLAEGFKENLTESAWTLTLNTIPAALFHAPVCDTASATADTGYPCYF